MNISTGGVNVLRTLLTVIFILIGLAITVIVLMQEGKAQGLGAISGVADTYWGKNKGRSLEGILVKATTALVVAFLIISVVLNVAGI
jgi:preprotein translocase subunit SecG